MVGRQATTNEQIYIVLSTSADLNVVKFQPKIIFHLFITISKDGNSTEKKKQTQKTRPIVHVSSTSLTVFRQDFCTFTLRTK